MNRLWKGVEAKFVTRVCRAVEKQFTPKTGTLVRTYDEQRDQFFVCVAQAGETGSLKELILNCFLWSKLKKWKGPLRIN